MHEQIPNWAFRFLHWTCSTTYLDELEGDLLELFDREVESSGLKKARRKFIRRALLSIRWYRLPKLYEIPAIMLYKNNYKVAVRHAIKHRSDSTVHTLGLMFGLAAVFYIGLFLKNELQFDSIHENGPQLYRVLRFNPETGERSLATSSLHGATIGETFPFTRVCRYGNDPVKIGAENPRLVDDFYWADSTYFELFSFEFIEGDPKTCLHQINSLVLSQSLKEKLFGKKPALGQFIKVKVYDGNQEFPMKVTAVVKDPPKTTHVQFEALGSMANAENLYGRLLQQWGFSWLRTYVEVPDQRIEEVRSGIPHLIQKYIGDDAPASFGMTFQPFQDVYLHSQDIAKSTIKGNIRNVQIFAVIGILILLVSLLNYVNLSTARGITRAKEVGIRKVLGSQNGAIFSQFMVESILFTFASGIAAILLVWGTLPYLNQLSQLDLSMHLLSWTDVLLIFFTLLGLGMLAGILPALLMSRLPVLSKSEENTIQFKVKEWPLTRKVFIGIQYFIALGLLVATIVVHQQYRFLKNYDLGFDAAQLLHIPVEDRGIQARLQLLKEQISALPDVQGVAMTGEDLPSELNNTWSLAWPGKDPKNRQAIDVIGVDRDYFEVLDIDFKKGNNFLYDYSVDSASTVILNEQAEQLIGLENLIDQQVAIGGRDRRVLGIVEDYHNTSLHAEIVPQAFLIFPPGDRVSPDNLVLKVTSRDIAPLLVQLEGIWKTFSSDPFKYNFVDEAFAEAYQAEQRFSSLVSAFTIIAIVVSLIGLFGLINFIIQVKLKEIGIRRVLGANFFSLMQLLGRDFIRVFVISALVALPVAYHFLNIWLDNYLYRVQISAVVLVLAVLICLLLSILVIYYHLQRNTRLAPSEIIGRE